MGRGRRNFYRRGAGAYAPATRTSYNCGQVGHLSINCPANNTYDHRNITCYNCGEVGHLSPSCLQRKSGLEHRTCFICNVQGHIAKYCPYSLQDSSGSTNPNIPRTQANALGTIEPQARFNESQLKTLALMIDNTEFSGMIESF